MKVDIASLILNEKQVVEEMLSTGVIPVFYTSKNVSNRVYRYFNGDVDKTIEELIKLDVVHIVGRNEKEYLEYLENAKQHIREMFQDYTEIRPLSQDKSIKIYKSELDKIKKLKSRTSQRTAFGMLMYKKIVNEKYNKPTNNVLRLDSMDEIFNYVTNVENTKAERQAWYDMQQNGIINVDWDCNIELKLLEFEGQVIQTIENNFDSCNYWFDKLVPENTNLETIVAVLPDGEVKIYEHLGFRGTAREFEKDFSIKVDNSDLRKCCNLKKKHCKKIIFFVLDETRNIEDMIKERQDLLKKKK